MSKIIRGVQPGPRRIVLYGPASSGKTSWAASAPDPLFIMTEDGARDLDVAKFPVASSFNEFHENMKEAASHVSEYKTLVIDSLDWLEGLIWKQLCEEEGVASIDSVGKGFGRGYVAAAAKIEGILRSLNWFTTKGLHLIMICHDQMIRVEDSENPPYDRVSLRLHKAAAGKVVEFADEVFYLRTKITIEEGERSNKARGGKVREMVCCNRPAILAKNRLRMPDTIPHVDPALGSPWAEYAKFLKGEA